MNFFIAKKHNVLILLLLGLCALLTYSSTSVLISEWLKWDQALSHGFACLVLVAFFIWAQPFVKKDFGEPRLGAQLLLAAASLCWCVAQLGNLQLPSYMFTLAIFWLLLLNLYGWPLAKALLPILGLFVFAVPVWSIFSDTLIQLSSNMVSFALQFSSLTLHIQDNQIMIPWGIIVIADGCSGLRYFVISLLLAYLLCLINGYSVKTSILVFVVAALLGLATNWLRILLIVLIAYYSEMQHSLVRDHEFFGWILFASILFPALYFSPQYKKHLTPIPAKICFSWKVMVALIVGPVIYFFIPFSNNNNPIVLSAVEQQFPTVTGSATLEINYPNKNIASTTLVSQGAEIYVELMTTAPQQKNEKIVPYMAKLYDDNLWRLIAHDNHVPNGKIEILENRIYQQKVLLMYKYQVGSFVTGDYYKAKIMQIPAKLLNQSYFGLWVAQVSCKINCEQELEAMQLLNAKW